MVPIATANTATHSPVGVIGLGLLGGELAQRLIGGGRKVIGFDVNAERQTAFSRFGGEISSSAAGVLLSCDRVFLSLPTHKEVADVISAAAHVMRRGHIIIDTTTGDPEPSEALGAELAAREVIYLDATISGSGWDVRNGSAIAMVGGDAVGFSASKDLLDLIAQQSFHTGRSGTGAKMKLVTNAVLGLNRAAFAEGLALAEGLGLDAAQALAIMRVGPAYSRIMDRKGEKMLKSDFTPEARLSQHLKDVRLILELGAQAALPMPLSAAHCAILEEAEMAGLGALDNSALVQVLRGLTKKKVGP
jgi:3-hydroxyisobutyrate dehydrogenase-like beta-hydroxyacid dehydrogenase